MEILFDFGPASHRLNTRTSSVEKTRADLRMQIWSDKRIQQQQCDFDQIGLRTNYCCNALINHTCLEIIENQCDREINSTNVSSVYTTYVQKHNQLRHGFMRHRPKAWRQVMKPRLLSSLAYTLQLHEKHLFIFIQRASYEKTITTGNSCAATSLFFFHIVHHRSDQKPILGTNS